MPQLYGENTEQLSRLRDLSPWLVNALLAGQVEIFPIRAAATWLSDF
jgi:hypothetical protein